MFKQTTYFPPSVLSVSAAHQFAVNRWNPQYSGLTTTGAAQGQQSSSGMSSSTPAAGIPIVCILRTQKTTEARSLWTNQHIVKNHILKL